MKDCERPAATILIVWCTTVCKQRHVIAHCAVGVASLYHVLIHAAVLWFHSHSAVGWQPISYSHSCSCIACYIYCGGLCACARFLLLEGHWFYAYHVSCVVVSTCTFRSEFTMVHPFSCQILQCSGEVWPISVWHPSQLPVVQCFEDTPVYRSVVINSLILLQ